MFTLKKQPQQNEEHCPPERAFAGKTLSSEDFEHVIVNHDIWLGSGGKLGCRADLTLADLTHVVLAFRNLARANLWYAVLGKVLQSANFSGAILYGVDLTHAKLVGAKLIGADLDHAKLMHAELGEADLTCARLVRADLTEADLTAAT